MEINPDYVNIEYLITLYKNQLEMKNKEIESLKKELNESEKRLKNAKSKSDLLKLENIKIKEFYDYNNTHIRPNNKENDTKRKTNANDSKNKINEIKNKIIANGCSFYNNVYMLSQKDYNDKNLITINNEDLNDILKLYELEQKLQNIEKCISNNIK